MNATESIARSYAPLPIRLMLGFAFAYHGFPKLFSAEAHQSFVGMLESIGVTTPGAAYFVGGLEFFGGILLIFGLGVRIIAALGGFEMVVAAVMVHRTAGFNFIHVVGTTGNGALQYGLPGYEVNLLYLAGFVSLILSGAGALAFRPSRRPRIAGRRREIEEEEQVPV